MSRPTGMDLGRFLDDIGLAVFVDRKGSLEAPSAAATMRRRAAHFALSERDRSAPDATRYAIISKTAPDDERKPGSPSGEPRRGTLAHILDAALARGVKRIDGRLSLKFDDLVVEFGDMGDMLGIGTTSLKVVALADPVSAPSAFHAPRGEVGIDHTDFGQKIWITGGADGLATMHTCLIDIEALAGPRTVRWELLPGTRQHWASSIARRSKEGANLRDTTEGALRGHDVGILTRHVVDAYLPMRSRRGSVNEGMNAKLVFDVDAPQASSTLGAVKRMREEATTRRLEANLVATRADEATMEAFRRIATQKITERR